MRIKIGKIKIITTYIALQYMYIQYFLQKISKNNAQGLLQAEQLV